MTTEDPVASFSLKEITLLDDAHTLGFRTVNWIEPPPFAPQPSETDQERYKRLADETDYRNDTKDSTAWYRYSTLGRYVVDGPTFDMILDKSAVDPVQVHCLIWYQYKYHVDRKLEIPPKLEAWATTKTMAYLASHAPGVLLLDTWKKTWVELSNEQSPSPPDDSSLDFTIQEWVAASLLVPHKDESSAAIKRRHQEEHVYRSKTSSTNWHRYLTLGRYALSGPNFDILMDDKDVDALKLHCVIWYNYMFHVDRMMECPPKLEAWAIHRSKPYLTTHQINALSVDTEVLTWKVYAKQQALSENWTQVKKKSKASKKQIPPNKPVVSAAKQDMVSAKPSTIPEESSEQSSSVPSDSKQCNTPNDASSAVSDGKMSVLMPSLNVPVCDGTYRVTLRLTVSADQMRQIGRAHV